MRMNITADVVRWKKRMNKPMFIKCKMCGGDLYPAENATTCECTKSKTKVS